MLFQPFQPGLRPDEKGDQCHLKQMIAAVTFPEFKYTVTKTTFVMRKTKMVSVVVLKNTPSHYLQKYSSFFVRNGTLKLS